MEGLSDALDSLLKYSPSLVHQPQPLVGFLFIELTSGVVNDILHYQYSKIYDDPSIPMTMACEQKTVSKEFIAQLMIVPQWRRSNPIECRCDNNVKVL